MKKLIILTILSSLFTATAFAQVSAAEKRYIRIGSLQSHFSAYGSERAWTGTYYEGLRWPAQYPYQDNSVIKRAWVAAKDFQDDEGTDFSYYAVYFYQGDEGISLFPMEMEQSAKFAPPSIYVDGDDLSSIFAADIDTVDVNQVPDRIVNNVVNTSMGLTQTRTILAFSQQYHDNYFIKIYTFTNTGNTDYDAEIELNDTLRAVRMGWGTRYSMGREAAWAMVDGSQGYGKHSWVTKRGEDYAAHQNDVITTADPIQQWIRAGWSYLGQSKDVTWDNIGAPDLDQRGRLTSPHHTGSAVLHVDKSWNDSTDNANQPTFLGWHAGDTYPSVGYQRVEDIPGMTAVYNMLSGIPYNGKGGNERMDEEYLQSITHRLDPFTVHGDGGGTNVMITYGPFDIPPGESVVIIEAEGINGLSRQMCEDIGARWLQAYENTADAGPFDLPDGSQTGDEDVYKNTWVATGKDSIMLTFSRALRNLDSGFNIPQPPLPPENFTVQSGGDRIILSWLASPSESDADFGGYRLFRAIGKSDTVHTEIFACGKGTSNPTIVHEFEDTTPVRGQSYFYYVVAFNDGSNNQTEMNPKGELHSGRFYTQTTQGAYLRRQAGATLEDIRIVPNPFNVKASGTAMAYFEQFDKIMFLDVPGQCTIRIFTERGDLIKTMEHTDGSGDHEWRLNTDYRQTLVSGVYLVHFETPEGLSAYRKLLVIR
ncbi:MAG: fibronectin [Candidatus Marinimicrobia bacterium]|nr:fibronectin [Candidatus Neomarinimicrobiota bacterium]MCF7851082.1 fibronectin [Candidatus Neomarinimicrobiota bacterium]MCF7905531.1 fibronectin [Candidatus Neomarinimicrobiota bacterium]